MDFSKISYDGKISHRLFPRNEGDIDPYEMGLKQISHVNRRSAQMGKTRKTSHFLTVNNEFSRVNQTMKPIKWIIPETQIISSTDLFKRRNIFAYQGRKKVWKKKTQRSAKMLSYFSLLCLILSLMLGDSLCNSSVKPRTKRSYSHNHSSKLTVKDLAVELAKKHLLKMILDEQHDLDKAKESVYILQRDSCTNIKSVGKSVAHNFRHQHQGAWMKDPLGTMGAETIFVMESYAGRKVLEEFENMEMFKAGIARKKYKLPYNYDGTGAVVYGPYLYYNRENSPYIVKFNLRTEREEAQISLSGFTPRKNGYQWCGGYCAVDLAVDEQGLWALWGDADNGYRLYAYKIDVYLNTVPQSWSLSTEKMNTMGNAFVACGVIYCIDSYNAKSTTINFAYDTKTGKQWNPNIQFTNQFGYNSMVAYNPRERVLYAWDAKRLVTYPITFEEH